MSRSDVESRMDDERARKAIEALAAGARLSHADLLVAQNYIEELFGLYEAGDVFYKHVASGDIYQVEGIGLRVGVDGPAYHEVEYSPISSPTVTFHRDWRDFHEKYRRTYKQEVWS